MRCFQDTFHYIGKILK